MVDEDTGNREPLIREEDRLGAIRESLEATERELREMGYRVERVVSHPGTKSSGLSSKMETLILVLHGEVKIESQGEAERLEAGSRLQVPSGVVYDMEVLSESSVYWIQGTRPEVANRPEERSGPRRDSTGS